MDVKWTEQLSLSPRFFFRRWFSGRGGGLYKPKKNPPSPPPSRRGFPFRTSGRILITEQKFSARRYLCRLRKN